MQCNLFLLIFVQLYTTCKRLLAGWIQLYLILFKICINYCNLKNKRLPFYIWLVLSDVLYTFLLRK